MIIPLNIANIVMATSLLIVTAVLRVKYGSAGILALIAPISFLVIIFSASNIHQHINRRDM